MGRTRILSAIGIAIGFSLLPLMGSVAAQRSRLDNISVDFLKVRRASGSVDSVSGTVFHRADAFTFIHTIAPTDQWIWVSQGFITIYYPSERRALRIRSDNPIDFSFFHAFLNIAGAELGLPRMGFTVAGTESQGDSLVTLWTPPEALAKSLGRARTVHENDRLKSLEYHERTGGLLLRIDFDNYLTPEAFSLPLHIALNRYGSSPVREHTYFSNPMFEKSRIDSIESLHIPPGIAIEDIGEK